MPPTAPCGATWQVRDQLILELAPGDRQAIDALNLRPENTDERPALRTSPEPMEPVPHEATGLFRRNEVTQVNRLVAEAESFVLKALNR